MLLQFVSWLNDLPWSVAIREGNFSFPIIETCHILALGASFGTIMWVDLRLMGFTMRSQPVSEVVEQLEPWAILGFVLMFISGGLLFFSEPLKAYTTLAFRIKMILIVLAGFNIWFFHRGIYKTIQQWDTAEILPWQARLVGFSSMVLWLGIIVAGRWTAYF
jgi:hypothetical protein